MNTGDKNTIDFGKNSIVYTNNKLGFRFTFPESWANKYEVVETKKGVAVYYLSKNKDIKKAELFDITIWGPEAE